MNGKTRIASFVLGLAAIFALAFGLGAVLEPAAHAPAGLTVWIEDADGATVREFDRRHEREMHLIVVRRDGTHFQHLHPELDAAGTWSTDLTLPAAGVYRLFADFSAAGEDFTLGSDLFAAGAYAAQPFAAGDRVDRVDGYEVRLESGDLHAGAPSALRFVVSKDGEQVTDPENYLGAKGNLVALREFKHGGVVRTAEFTVAVPR